LGRNHDRVDDRIGQRGHDEDHAIETHERKTQDPRRLVVTRFGLVIGEAAEHAWLFPGLLHVPSPVVRFWPSPYRPLPNRWFSPCVCQGKSGVPPGTATRPPPPFRLPPPPTAKQRDE